MVKILPELEWFSLCKREAEILSWLFHKHSSTAKQIAMELRISEQKIYPYLKNLAERGYVVAEESRPSRYSLGHSSAFKRKLEKQRRDMKKAKDFLLNLAHHQSEINRIENPFIKTAATLDENLRLQLYAIDIAKKEFLQVLNIYHTQTSNRRQKSQFEKAIARMLERGVNYKTIYPETKKVPKLLDGYKNRFEFRRLNTTFQRCDIIDRRYILLKILDENDVMNFIGAIFIDDPDLAKNLRYTFFKLWETAK